MKNDSVCWHQGSCKGVAVKVFRDKKWREIPVCHDHAGIYHKSEDFNVARVLVPA